MLLQCSFTVFSGYFCIQRNLLNSTPLFTSYLSYTGGLGSSVILGDLDHDKYLIQLITFLHPALPSASRNYFVRCWHAKTDGSAASTFHSNCDGKGPTVTIIKYGQYIFGGYTDRSWKSTYVFLIIIRYIFSSFSLAESPPRDLQITAYK